MTTSGTVSGTIINLSNVYRATDAGAPRADRSAFLIQTWEASTLSQSDHIFIVCGDFLIDDVWASAVYLATICQDGGYRIERAEPYLEPWERPEDRHSERALNTRHLPDAVNNMAFYKALEYPRPRPSEQFWFNRWCEGIISAYGRGVLYAPFPNVYPKDRLRIDFADGALLCDGRPIRRLELAKCVEDSGMTLEIARRLLEKTHEFSANRLYEWFAAHEGGKDTQERLVLYEQEPEPEKDWGRLIHTSNRSTGA